MTEAIDTTAHVIGWLILASALATAGTWVVVRTLRAITPTRLHRYLRYPWEA